MEVFVAYTKNDNFNLLERTLEAWDKFPEATVGMIEMPPHKYEIGRRVAADGLAKRDHYILADLGCVLSDYGILVPKFTHMEMKLIDSHDALIGLCPEEQGDVNELAKAPTGVRICRKGVVTKWPPKETATYDKEHADAVRMARWGVALWTDLFYKRLITEAVSHAN